MEVALGWAIKNEEEGLAGLSKNGGGVYFRQRDPSTKTQGLKEHNKY